MNLFENVAENDIDFNYSAPFAENDTGLFRGKVLNGSISRRVYRFMPVGHRVPHPLNTMRETMSPHGR